MSENKSKSIDIIIPMMLFPVFLILKCFGLVDWSWWWVTSPVWIHFLNMFIFAFAGFLGMVVNTPKE